MNQSRLPTGTCLVVIWEKPEMGGHIFYYINHATDDSRQPTTASVCVDWSGGWLEETKLR